MINIWEWMTELATERLKEASIHVSKSSLDNDCRHDAKCLLLVNHSWPSEYFAIKKLLNSLTFNKK